MEQAEHALRPLRLPADRPALRAGLVGLDGAERGVFLPAHVTSVGADAFAECAALEAVCFAAVPLEIGDSVFEACDTLHFVFFPGSYEQWKCLYEEDISPSTYICCSDGIFPQND